MASSKPAKETAAKDSDAPATWKPTAEAKKKATTFRVIAIILWVIAIAGELVGIFWLLKQTTPASGPVDGLQRDAETGLLYELSGQGGGLAQWAFITLMVLLVVIAILSITGSMLWKKANALDPASQKDTFRFFVQNQLGAIIAIIAFLPLILMIFLNKDMNKSQKSVAGIAGIVLAVAAVALGVDFNPKSTEQYTADQSTVIQLLGSDEVHWVAGGSVYHVCADVADIANATSEQQVGTTAQAIEAGKSRLTLELQQELNACNLPVPENISDIVGAIREIRDGAVDTVLPGPVYADGVTPPFTPGS